MYQLITSYVQPRGQWNGELEADIASKPIREVYSTSLRVILVLSEPSLTSLQTLDLKDVQEDIYQLPPSTTVNEWLQGLGNQALPTRAGLPEITKGRVASVSAFIAGFSVDIWDKNANPNDAQTTGPGADLKLTKVSDDDKVPGDYLLATVNGAFHVTDYNDKTIFVEGGGFSSILKDSIPSVQLYSFAEIGKVKQIPFTYCVFGGGEDQPMNKGVYVQLPEDIGNRTVFVSIGGVLHPYQKGWNVTGDRNLLLAWSHLAINDIYLNTRELIRWDEVEARMDMDPLKVSGVEQHIFSDDDSITAILNMPQSFVVLIDNPNVLINAERLEDTGLPGKYYHYGDGDIPVRMSNGLMPHYVPIKERVATKKPVWVLGINPIVGKWYRYYSDTRPINEYDFRPNALRSQFPFEYAKAYHLNIQSVDITLPELI